MKIYNQEQVMSYKVKIYKTPPQKKDRNYAKLNNIVKYKYKIYYSLTDEPKWKVMLKFLLEKKMSVKSKAEPNL